MSGERPESPSAARGDDLLEGLVAECLERMESEGTAALDDVCRKHPDQAAGVRRWLDILARTGLHGAPSEVPDRIGGLRLLRRLGAGGMGVVYLAEDERLRRRVAIKLIRPERLFFPGSRERFQREVEAAARLEHPAIVSVYGIGIDQNIPFFSMEMVEGCPLAEVLRELQGTAPESLDGRSLANALAAAVRRRDARPVTPSGPLFEDTWVRACIRIAEQISEALEHAHRHGIVHRDVKPSNVLLTPQGQPRLFDFGLAMTEGASPLTSSGAQPGSLPYMAPEQLDARVGGVDARTDVYALGVSIYEMLTLRPPFAGEGAEVIRSRIIDGGHEPVGRYNRRVPADAATVCLTAMEKDPSRRYSSAAMLGRDLRNLLEHRTIEARSPSWTLRARRWVQRHPTSSTAMVLLSLLAIGSTWFGLEQASARESLANEQARTSLERDRANDAASELNRSLRDLRRLSDARLVADHVAVAEALWPPDPARLPAIASWQKEARGLMDRRADHAALLARLSSAADSRDPSAVEALSEGEQRWQTGVLTRLLEDLGKLEARMKEVDTLRSDAVRLSNETVESREASEAWDHARRAIAAHPAYAGLVVPPQLGLLPLGPDPRSRLWEFWHVLSGERPQREEEGESLAMKADDGLVLVLIPGGTVRLGADLPDEDRAVGDPNVDQYATAWDLPSSEVTIEPYFISKFELTQCQWKRLTGSNPSVFRGNDPQRSGCSTHPVDTVSLKDCTEAFYKWDLVIPTQSQWERAARGGTTTIWWTGNAPESIKGAANIADASYKKSGLAPPRYDCEQWIDDDFAWHAPVGTFLPNPFGLHDTMGNVVEWCQDGDRVPAPHAGFGPSDRFSMRGGGFASPSGNCRSAAKARSGTDMRFREVGVRPARLLVR